MVRPFDPSTLRQAQGPQAQGPQAQGSQDHDSTGSSTTNKLPKLECQFN